MGTQKEKCLLTHADTTCIDGLSKAIYSNVYSQRLVMGVCPVLQCKIKSVCNDTLALGLLE